MPVTHTESPAPVETTTEEPSHRKAARNVWAMLLARIYEVLPLVCPHCGGEMKIIGFINEAVVIREILGYLGEPISPLRLLPARGPQLWEMQGLEPLESDPRVLPAPDFEFDQRVARSTFPVFHYANTIRKGCAVSPQTAEQASDSVLYRQ